MVYTAGQAANILGISRRKVIYYLEQGLVHALNPAEVHQGKHRHLSKAVLFQMSIAVQLEPLGFTPKRMRPLLDLLRSENPTLDHPVMICEANGGLQLTDQQEVSLAAPWAIYQKEDNDRSTSSPGAVLTLNLQVMAEEFHNASSR